MPSQYYQKKLLCIKRIEETIGISNLLYNLKSVARLRLQHPDWSNKQIADALDIYYGAVVNCFFKIKCLVERNHV